jgi:adenylylsulfate kinase
MAGRAFWITGLPGSGKSTMADRLKAFRPGLVVLRMDDLREIVTPDPTYSDTEREFVYRSIVYFAKKLTELGHEVVIDATGNLRKWRELAREVIPTYSEIYLKCRIDECMNREIQRHETHKAPADIYTKGKSGWPVPGLAAPYEEPLNPEIVIDTEEMSVSEAANLILERFFQT